MRIPLNLATEPPENLRPVRLFGPRRLTMLGGDRRLQRERAGSSA